MLWDNRAPAGIDLASLQIKAEERGDHYVFQRAEGFQYQMSLLPISLDSSANGPQCGASEAFQKAIYQQHLDGINRSRLGRREGIGAATVERYFRRGLQRQFAEWHPPRCPQFLGIDEHFFTRRKGYATTLCDLKNHKVYDVVLGRSETALEAYFQRLEGKEHVLLVCMDLSSPYRALVRRFFPNARIVADRFHVIRIINHHFLACWRDIDPTGSRNRGLLSLMRRHRHNLNPVQQERLSAYLLAHPALEVIYRFKQRLCYLLLNKHRTRKQCEALAPRFLRAVYQLRQAGLAGYNSDYASIFAKSGYLIDNLINYCLDRKAARIF